MKTVPSKVRCDGKVVSTIDIPVYENLEEAVAKETLEEVLKLFNKANRVKLQGIERDKFRPKKPTKDTKFWTGYQLLPDIEFEDGETGTDKLLAAAGDPDKLKQLMDSPEVVAAVEAQLGESSQVGDEDDSDEE